MLHYTWLLYLLSLVHDPTSHPDDNQWNREPKNLTEHNTPKSVLPDGGKKWAVLVAGSKGWDNYRHQADVCGAYQILHRQGIPDEHIIVMMYDDIATNIKNKMPGVIINEPNGPDVYKGVPKDYTGQDVTVENFLNILQGNDMIGIGSGKTIRSGPNDHIFIYLVSHGGPGFLSFPHKQFLYADQLKNAIETMHGQKKYANMLIYIDGCFSGSMLSKSMTQKLNVFATTAALRNENSYACEYDKTVGQYVNDLYSLTWMDDSSKYDPTKRTIGEQYETVKNVIQPYSRVRQYGDMDMHHIPISDFLGSSQIKNFQEKIRQCGRGGPVAAKDVDLEVLKNQIEDAETQEQKKKLENDLQKAVLERKFLAKQVDDIVTAVAIAVPGLATGAEGATGNQEINNYECYSRVIYHYHKQCADIEKHPYITTQLSRFVFMCNNDVDELVIAEAMDGACRSRY